MGWPGLNLAASTPTRCVVGPRTTASRSHPMQGRLSRCRAGSAEEILDLFLIQRASGPTFEQEGQLRGDLELLGGVDRILQ